MAIASAVEGAMALVDPAGVAARWKRQSPSGPPSGWLAPGPDPHTRVVHHGTEAATGGPWRLSARVATAGEPGPCPQPGSLGTGDGCWGGSARHQARSPDDARSGRRRDRGDQGPRPPPRQSAGELTVPRSMLWPVVGFVQLLAGAVLLFAIAWYLLVIFGPGQLPVATVDVPYLVRIPTPSSSSPASLVLSLLLGFVLNLHARWIGRRAGQEVATRVGEAVSRSITTVGFGGLDAVEAARRHLASVAAIAASVGARPVSGSTSEVTLWR